MAKALAATFADDQVEQNAIRSGPVFRGIDRFGWLQGKRLNPASAARILKRDSQSAGFDETRLAGHSRRRRLLHEAHLNDVVRQIRH